MTVYIDQAFKCSAEPGEGLMAAESEFFDGKCAALIACYRFVPEGQTWEREDGAAFSGEMIAPHRDTAAAMTLQAEYERMAGEAGNYAAAYEEGVQNA